MKNKIGVIAILLVLLSVLGLFIFLFVNCIKLYSTFDITYNDLKYKELTFIKYEVIVHAKGGDDYEIYFEEYDKPFEISNITQKRLDKKALKELQENTKVKVYFLDYDSKKYDYKICEMRTNTNIYLSLDDYIKVNQNNQIVGMVLCPFMILDVLFLGGLFIYNVKKNQFIF